MLLKMMIMEKSRFGVSMMVFVFLLSLLPYGATAIQVSDVIYRAVEEDDETFMEKLHTEIKTAISNDQQFYIGAAKARLNETPIQSLCSRQGETDTEPDAIRCTKSNHKADEKAKLKMVFYTNRIISEPEVCGIEETLIREYLKVDPKCLNKRAGHPCCIAAREGIVYLRIYEKPSNHRYPARQRCAKARAVAKIACSKAISSRGRGKKGKRPGAGRPLGARRAPGPR